MFVSGVVSIAFFHASFSPVQLAVALIAVPFLTTLAEAWSPHTWDTPYMFLAGTTSLLAIKIWL